MELATISPPRSKLTAAAAHVHAERGYVDMNVDQIVAYAELPRAAFFEHFAGKVDCIAAVQEQVCEELRARIHSAWSSADDWPRQVDAALAAVLDFASSDPQLAAVLLPTSLLVEPSLAERIWAMNDCLAEGLRAGRLKYPQADQPPEETEQVLVGGVQGLIGARLRAGRAGDLRPLRAAITQTVLTPYLGSELAQRVAHRNSGADR
jgi:AcrR family transcriptional regulator